MSFVRRHLSWMVCGWLVCQMASVAAAPLAFCCKDVPAADPDDKCCPGLLPGQICPMHHTREGVKNLQDAQRLRAGGCGARSALAGGLATLSQPTPAVNIFDPYDRSRRSRRPPSSARTSPNLHLLAPNPDRRRLIAELAKAAETNSSLRQGSWRFLSFGGVMRSFAWSPSIWPAALCLLLSTIPGHAAPPATLGVPGRQRHAVNRRGRTVRRGRVGRRGAGRNDRRVSGRQP